MLTKETFSNSRQMIVFFKLLTLLVSMFTDKMKSRQMILGWTLVCLISTSSFMPVLAYPNVAIQGPSQESGPQYEQFTPQDAVHDARKFAEKPNSIKKIQALEDRNDLDDLSTNNITVRD